MRMVNYIMLKEDIQPLLSENYELNKVKYSMESVKFSDRAFNKLINNNIISNINYKGKSIIYKTDKHDNLAISNYAIFDDVAYISWIWIHRAIRGHGYGKKLVSQTINQLNNYNVSQIYTLPKSEIANHIFNKKGFTESEIPSFLKLKL